MDFASGLPVGRTIAFPTWDRSLFEDPTLDIGSVGPQRGYLRALGRALKKIATDGHNTLEPQHLA